MARLVAPLAACILLPVCAAGMVGNAKWGNAALASHVVAVVGTNGSVCSGTVIARDLVLTAAHCVDLGFEFAVFELGDSRLRETDVVRFEQHPQFDFGASNMARPTVDLAILKLAKPLSARIVPVALGAREFFPAGDKFRVAGVGSVSDANDGTFGRLLVAGLTTVPSRSDLQLRLVDPVTRGKRPGVSACSGDSGGPVFEDTRSGLVLVGIVSWAATVSGSPGCGGITGATPIAPVRTWIIETAMLLGSSIAPAPSVAILDRPVQR